MSRALDNCHCFSLAPRTREHNIDLLKGISKSVKGVGGNYFLKAVIQTSGNHDLLNVSQILKALHCFLTSSGNRASQATFSWHSNWNSNFICTNTGLSIPKGSKKLEVTFKILLLVGSRLSANFNSALNLKLNWSETHFKFKFNNTLSCYYK